MFDEHQCVAEITQPMECLDQSSIVSGMQSDRRFVQHIKNTRQSATNLTCQSDALILST